VDLLVLGLGNPLCSDDGLGVAAVHELLRRYDVPEGAVVLDGGTLGLALLPHFEDARAAILVDAIRADGEPGSLVRLEGGDVAPAVACRLSPHQVGVVDLLDAARLLGHLPEPLVLVGLVPESLGLGFGLTPPVAGRMDALLQRVAEEMRALGFPLIPKKADEEERSRHDAAVPLVAGL
jgi:hydrogenase maturation protease